jgi:peptidoglycan glycosyltransferase
VPADSRGHIVTAVTAELEELGITEQHIAQEGLRITTTIDPDRQELAVEAAHAALDRQPVNLRTAMVAIDPETGGVLAYYGGDNGLGLDYAQVRKLAGSTFKPFVVLAALQQEPPVGLGEVFDGEEVPGLRNAEGADCDECDLKQAMTISNNVVFHTLTKQIGAEAVAAAARSAGITAPLDDPTEGIALGNKEVSTLELASAYATIAAGGVWRQPHLVASVVTADDRVLYEAATEGERRFPERVARNVTEAMLGVAERDDLALPGGRPVAAKTGTVQSRFEGENNDAWMAGFTPSLASAVWLGTDMNSPIRTARGTPISGSSLPGDVWQDFMTEALDDAPVEDFPPFRAIGEPPSPLGPNEEPEPPPSPATPTPAPGVPPPPGVPPGPDGAEAPVVTPLPEEPGFDGAGTPGVPADRDDNDERPDEHPDEQPEDEDCSITPCG